MDAEIESLLEGLSDDGDSVIKIDSQLPLPKVYSEDTNSASLTNNSALPQDLDVTAIDAQIDAQFRLLQTLFEPRAPIMKDRDISVEQYVNLVRIVGNKAFDVLLVEPQFRESLGRVHSLALTIFYSSNDVPLLPDATFADVNATCAKLSELFAKKKALLADLETEIAQTMPNFGALVSLSVGAQLLAKLGGLRALAAVPPSNLVNPHNSVLAEDPLIREVPDKYKRAALRILAAKLVLAARVDAAQLANPQINDGSDRLPLAATLKWKRNIRLRIDQLLAPPPSLQQRSLPKPVNKPMSRRGGRKLRKRRQKQAEKLGQPEIIKFGE